MFSEEQIKAYKSIKAPEGLRGDSIGAASEYARKHKERLLRIRAYSGIAACFILVVAIGFFSMNATAGATAPVLYFDGNAVSVNEISVPSPRTVSYSIDGQVAVMLELKSKSTATVLAENSFLWLDDSEETVTEFEFKGKTRFQWLATASEDAQFILRVSDADHSLVYILRYDAETLLWTISERPAQNNN